ncbi:MAG: VWA domain-containing protein [bacterium]|nr:VWA domain-containing protein [bacterium]
MIRGALRPLAVASCLAIAAATAAAQEERYFETVDVRVVNVEVIVTDKDGKPVTGLQRDDFELYEDGQLVELTNFFAAEGREPTAAGGGDAEVQQAAMGTGPATRRLNLVIFVDNLNASPRNRNAILDNLGEHLGERLDPRDRVMLVTYDGDVDVVEPFTDDKSLVLAGLERLKTEAGPHGALGGERRMFLTEIENASTKDYDTSQPRDPQFEMAVAGAVELSRSLRTVAERGVRKVRATATALEAISGSLAGIPGRKALVYVSDGLPRRPAEALVQEFSDKFENWMMSNERFIPSTDYQTLQRTMTSLNSSEFDASRAFRKLGERAGSERVAFYPISPGGQVDSYRTADVATSVSRTAINIERFAAESSLLDMAKATGGLAFTSTADVAGLLDRLVDDFTSFYSLGYSSPKFEEGRFHKLAVKVRDKELRVRHLRGYRDRSTITRLQELAVAALHYGLGSNPLEVRLQPGQQVASEGGPGYRVSVMVMIPFRNLLLRPGQESHDGWLSLVVVLRDEASGGVSTPQRIDLPIRIPNEQILQAMQHVAAYPLDLEIKRGRKRLAVAVHDHLARVDSTVHVELTVGEGGE